MPNAKEWTDRETLKERQNKREKTREFFFNNITSNCTLFALIRILFLSIALLACMFQLFWSLLLLLKCPIHFRVPCNFFFLFSFFSPKKYTVAICLYCLASYALPCITTTAPNNNKSKTRKMYLLAILEFNGFFAQAFIFIYLYEVRSYFSQSVYVLFELFGIVFLVKFFSETLDFCMYVFQ